MRLIRRDFALALAFTIFGVVFTMYAYPAIRAVEVVLPFASGVAAGIALGRGLWAHRVSE